MLRVNRQILKRGYIGVSGGPMTSSVLKLMMLKLTISSAYGDPVFNLKSEISDDYRTVCRPRLRRWPGSRVPGLSIDGHLYHGKRN